MWTYPLKTMHVYSRGQLSVSHLVAAKDTLQSSSPSTWRQFSYLELFHGWSLWQEIDVIELLFFSLWDFDGCWVIFSFFFFGLLCVLWRGVDLRPVWTCLYLYALFLLGLLLSSEHVCVGVGWWETCWSLLLPTYPPCPMLLSLALALGE